MDNRLIINQPLQPGRKTDVKRKFEHKRTGNEGPAFKKVLAEQLKEQTGVKFSKHAQNRILSREIQVNAADLKQLKNGVEKAEEKGARDSLIMVNKVAFVVSVENKTVITAIDDQSLKENVFTNIDSAVFM